MHRIIYLSRNALPADAASQRVAFAEILSASRRNNARHGLTGALMFNSGCFIQVLEGERDALDNVFSRIALDQRHSGIVILQSVEIEERAFEGWTMAFVGQSSEARGDGASAAIRDGLTSGCLDGESILAYMCELVLMEEDQDLVA